MANSNTFILLILWMIIIMIGTSNTGKSYLKIISFLCHDKSSIIDKISFQLMIDTSIQPTFNIPFIFTKFSDTVNSANEIEDLDCFRIHSNNSTFCYQKAEAELTISALPVDNFMGFSSCETQCKHYSQFYCFFLYDDNKAWTTLVITSTLWICLWFAISLSGSVVCVNLNVIARLRTTSAGT